MALKDRVLIKFPALVLAAEGVGLTIANGVYSFFLQLMNVASVDSVADPTTRFLVVASDNGDGTELHERISMSGFAAAVGGIVQEITFGGTQNINAASGVVQVNQTVGAPITLNLPAASGKIGRVKIVDWKGDAGTNNITIVPNGSETFQGGLTSWTIATNGASVDFSPIPGKGYAV